MTSVAVAPKLYLDGTHRTVEPAITLERLRPLLPIIGVTRVAAITGLDVIGLPVVMVERPSQPEGPVVATVDEALAWVEAQLQSTDGYVRGV